MPDPDLDWRDNVPVSTLYDDPYFSLAGGLAETRHVFLDGNDLPARFEPGFHIAELGFRDRPERAGRMGGMAGIGQTTPLRVTSFESHPMGAEAMARAMSAFSDLRAIAPQLVAAWATGARDIDLPGLHLRVIEGAAETTLPDWPGRADAWFLDGFSPAKNTALWSRELMEQVAAHTAPGGTLATYTAAGHVRRALGDAGFTVTRTAGFGRKRHMTRGWLSAGA